MWSFPSLLSASVVGALLLLHGSACQLNDRAGRRSVSDAGATDGQAIDAQSHSELDVLENAAKVAREASAYISFDYAHDGCHDRSILIAAELAAAGIPSNAQFIVPSDGMLTPRQHPGIEWNYHVAPVIYLPELGAPSQENELLSFNDGSILGPAPAGAYIVDPSLYPEEIVAPLARWVEDMSSQGQTGFLATYDAREALNAPSNAAKAEEDKADILPGSFDEMPRFWQFQLGSACGFLSRDAGNLAGEIGQEGVDEVRSAMNVGVRALLVAMTAQDLLLNQEPIPDLPCWSL